MSLPLPNKLSGSNIRKAKPITVANRTQSNVTLIPIEPNSITSLPLKFLKADYPVSGMEAAQNQH